MYVSMHVSGCMVWVVWGVLCSDDSGGDAHGHQLLKQQFAGIGNLDL